MILDAQKNTLSASEMIDRLVVYGVNLASRVLQEGYTSINGVPKQKSPSDRRDDRMRLSAVAMALDQVQWYGPWGMNPHAIEMELVRRARG